MHTHTHTRVYKHIDVQIHTHMHMYTYIMSAHIHTYTYIHTRIQNVHMNAPSPHSLQNLRCQHYHVFTGDFNSWVGTEQEEHLTLFLTRLGFEKILKTQGIFKTQKSGLLVLWKGVINPLLQSLVNQIFSQREKCWLTKFEQFFSKKNH